MSSLIPNPPMGVHILVIPYPAQGHMRPTLDLSRQLSLRGLEITIVVTPKNLETINPFLIANPSIHTLVFPFPTHPQIPAGVENIKELGNHGNPIMVSALTALYEPIKEWFKFKTHTSSSPPKAIISDFFLGWTHQLGVELGIPRLALFTSGAFLACVVSHLFTADDDGGDGGFEPMVEFTDLPRSPRFKWEHLPSIYRVYKSSRSSNPSGGGVVFKESTVANLSSWGCIFNSFRYLEGEYLDHFGKQHLQSGRVFGVGPVNLYGSPPPCHQEDKRLFDWLDSCPDDESVLYISFGSQKCLTKLQSEAVALALEQSGIRFVWVGGLELNGKDEQRGFVAKGWVSQVEVLNHRAVGGFLTHCGWNSVLEGLTAGVMMLGWPMEADQFVNAKLLVDDLGVGVRVCEGADTVPEVDKLGQEFRSAFDGEQQEERGRRRKMKEKAVEAVSEGGSSMNDLEELVKQLNQFAT